MGEPTADQVIEQFADTMDAQDWDGLAALLATDFTARHVHNGRRFDRQQFVMFNRDYPGSWRFRWEDVVCAGDRAVARARVFYDRETYYAACFLTVTDGTIVDLVEVWTDPVTDPPGPS